MEDNLSELDELIESDILHALGEEIPLKNEIEDVNINASDDIILEDFIEEDKNKDEELDIVSEEKLEKEWEEELNIQNETIKKEKEAVQMVDINTTDLSSLLSQLLNNKTIEITIKIKD